MQELLKILKEIAKLLEEMTVVAQKKFDAAVQNKILDIENCMKQEQAFLLRMRGLDKKRESLQKQLGYESLTMRQIIDQQPRDVREPIEQMFRHLQEQLKQYQKIAKTAEDALQVNLHRIDRSLEKLRPNQVGVYGEDGHMMQESKIFSNRRV